MKKGYQVIEPRPLGRLVRSQQFDVAVSFLNWLIQELNADLGDRLHNVEIEVIPVEYLGGPYPALGVYYKESPHPDLSPLIESRVTQILQDRPALAFLDAVQASPVSWQDLVSGYRSTSGAS